MARDMSGGGARRVAAEERGAGVPRERRRSACSRSLRKWYEPGIFRSSCLRRVSRRLRSRRESAVGGAGRG